MDNRRVVYSPRPDTTPETELSILAAIYRFAVACHPQERGRLPDKSGPDAGKEIDERSGKSIIPE
jgi:hypothetical protein